jgi:hypothetical protein
MKMNEIVQRRRATGRHLICLMDEIIYLNTLLQPHDTGHIYTAINVLRDSVEKIVKELEGNDK